MLFASPSSPEFDELLPSPFAFAFVTDGNHFFFILLISSDSHFLLSLADALNIFHDAPRLLKNSDNYGQYSDIILPLFRCLQSYRQSNLLEAYTAFEKAANAFVQEFRNWESAWAMEALYAIVYDVRVLAEKVSIYISFFFFFFQIFWKFAVRFCAILGG
ncbi:uncharacterized protein DS421_16g542580 [Arachis hypogaea]|nr:uncharacterized protein DS421_16g542580 [Arachis hypogaea]